MCETDVGRVSLIDFHVELIDIMSCMRSRQTTLMTIACSAMICIFTLIFLGICFDQHQNFIDAIEKDPEIVYKDRVEYKDRVVYKDRIVYKDRVVYEEKKVVKEVFVPKIEVRVVEKKVPTIQVVEKVVYKERREYLDKIAALEKEIDRLETKYNIRSRVPVQGKKHTPLSDYAERQQAESRYHQYLKTLKEE